MGEERAVERGGQRAEGRVQMEERMRKRGECRQWRGRHSEAKVRRVSQAGE